MATTAFLHGVEHDGQLGAPAFKLGKIPAEPHSGFVEGGFSRGELVESRERAGGGADRIDAGSEIAGGDAMGEVGDAA